MLSSHSSIAVFALVSSFVSVVAGESVLHQFKPRAGGFQDTCAYVKTTLTYTVKKTTYDLAIAQALCVDNLPSFIQSNEECQQAITRGYAASDLQDLIANAVESTKGAQTCSFPKNALEDPQKTELCAFVCGNGFEVYPAKAPTQCNCPSGKSVCNGQCITTTNGACPSAAAKAKREPKSWWVDDRCREGYSVCGVVNAGPKAWECVDTSADLWSCGGCAIPTAGSLGGPGQDCTAIAHTSSVACVAGQCNVFACTRGYEPSADGSHCMPKESNESEWSFLPAHKYGLEHSPLRE